MAIKSRVLKEKKKRNRSLYLLYFVTAIFIVGLLIGLRFYNRIFAPIIQIEDESTRDIFIPSNGLSAANSSSSPRRRGILFFTQDIFWCPKGARDISFTSCCFIDLSYSTVTDFARFFGLSILHPLFFAT